MIWIVLTILILPAFLFWGIGQKQAKRNNKQSQSDYIGKIYGKKVSFAKYREALEATRNFAILQFGEDISKIEKLLNLESQAWDRLILLAEAKKRGINVSDQDVVSSIQSFPFLQQKGKFDERSYNQIVKYVFHTQPRAFEEQIRQNLIIAKLFTEISKSVQVEEKEVKDEYIKENEKMSIDYIFADPAEFAKDAIVTEWQMKDYYNKNSLEFKQPPTCNLEYIMPASDQEVDSIVFNLKKNDSFDKIAKDFKLPVKETGSFNAGEPIPGIGYSQEVMDIVSKLKIGDILPPILIYNKYYLMRIKGKLDSVVPEFETIKDQIKGSLVQNQSRDLAKEKTGLCLKKIRESSAKTNTSDFSGIAKEFGLKLSTSELFTFNDVNKELGSMDVFYMAANNLKENEFSEPISTMKGFYIIRRKELIPIDESKYKEEKPLLSEKVLNQKKQEYFNKYFGELKKKAQEF